MFIKERIAQGYLFVHLIQINVGYCHQILIFQFPQTLIPQFLMPQFPQTKT